MNKFEYTLVAGQNGQELVENLNKLAEDTDEDKQWEVITVTSMGAAYHQAFLRREVRSGPRLA